MFTNTYKPYKPANSGKRKYLAALTIMGAACIALGLYGFSRPQIQTKNMDAYHAYVGHLMEHHDYMASKKNVLDELAYQGATRMMHT